MKKIQINILKTYLLASVFAVSLFAISSCARKTTFMTSSVVPAARGEVKVKKDDNQNYNIKVKLSDLAEIKRLDPSKETYVVWMISEEGNTENLGQLNSSKSMFSNNLKGSLETVSSSKPSKIFVTAENDASTQYPNEQIIMSTENFWNLNGTKDAMDEAGFGLSLCKEFIEGNEGNIWIESENGEGS